MNGISTIKGFFHKGSVSSQLIMVGGKVYPANTKQAFDDTESRKLSATRIVDRFLNGIRNYVILGFCIYIWWAFWYYLKFVEKRRRSFDRW